jgi:protease-4
MTSTHPIRRLASVASVAMAALGLLGCEGRPRAALPGVDSTSSNPAEPHLGELDLRQGAPEGSDGSWFTASGDRSFARLAIELRGLGRATALRGLFVRLGVARFGLAQAEEIGRGLGAVREKGLPVVCHADGYDNASVLLAARGCSEIWLSPSGGVDSVGIAGQLVFGRALLQKLSIEADFLQMGRYKGAEEPFTRDESSPESRESMRGTLAALRQAWVDGITTGRGKDAEALGIEDGPWVPGEAEARGLTDRTGYAEQARDEALVKTGLDNRVVYFGERDATEPNLAELFRALSGARAHTEPYVAVVRAVGAIGMSSGSPLGGGDGISARALSKVLRRLAEDENAMAVVVRIDSPGGSALASDLLWQELMTLRARKPVVASVGGMAASGGCYLFSAATQVVAEPTSIVGSIGVVAGKLSFAKSLAELGVHVETIEAKEGTGPRALYESALAPWDEATRAKVRTAIEATYELFVERVAEGRGTSPERIQAAAEGRIYGGVEGKALGLVDQLGGLTDAIDLALRLGKLPPDAPVEVADPSSGLAELLVGDSGARALAAEQIERQATRSALRVVSAGLEPYRAEVDAFLGSAAPLLQGERVLTALPFVLVVR